MRQFFEKNAEFYLNNLKMRYMSFIELKRANNLGASFVLRRDFLKKTKN